MFRISSVSLYSLFALHDDHTRPARCFEVHRSPNGSYSKPDQCGCIISVIQKDGNERFDTFSVDTKRQGAHESGDRDGAGCCGLH